MDVRRLVERLTPDQALELAIALPPDVLEAAAIQRGIITAPAGAAATREEVLLDTETSTTVDDSAEQAAAHEVAAEFERIFDLVSTHPYTIGVCRGDFGGSAEFYNQSYDTFSALSPEGKRQVRSDLDAKNRRDIQTVLQMPEGERETINKARENVKTRNGALYDRKGMLYQDSSKRWLTYNAQSYDAEGITEAVTRFPARIVLGNYTSNHGVSILEGTTIRQYKPGGGERSPNFFCWNILMSDEQAESILSFLEANPEYSRVLGDRLMFSGQTVGMSSEDRLGQNWWQHPRIPVRPPYEQWQQENDGTSRIAFRRAYDEQAQASNIVTFVMDPALTY